MFENGSEMAGIFAYTNVPDAIEAIKEKEPQDIIIGFPKEAKPDERKAQMQQLSDFLETNPSVSRIIFSEGHVQKGNVAALNKEELGILAKGLEKNTNVTGIDLINEETYERFAESPHAVDYTGSLVVQKDPSKIKDKKKLKEYEELREIISPSLERNAHINDAIYDIAKATIGAKLVSSVLSDESISEDAKKNLDFFDGIATQIIKETRKTLLEGLSAKNVEALADYWTQPAQQGKIGKEKDYEGKEWPPIFGQEEIDVPKSIAGEKGWKISTLTNSSQLVQEGQDLEHCVGGYTEHCLLGESHIVSIRDSKQTSEAKKNGAVSTIEFRTDYENQEHHVIQHYGKGNSKVGKIPKKIEEAIKENLGEQAQEGPRRGIGQLAKRLFRKNNSWPDIAIDYESLASEHTKRDKETRERPGGTAMMQLGFNPTDADKMRRINDLYKNVVAPTGEKATNREKKEIDNFDSEVRSKLRKNFAKLRDMEQIDIAPSNVDGKSTFDLEPKKEKATKPVTSKKSWVDESLAGEITSSLETIFGQEATNGVQVVSDKSKAKKKGDMGDTALILPQNADIEHMTQRLEEIFTGKKPVNISHNSENNSLVIEGASLKNTKDILGGYARGLNTPQARGVGM